MSEGTADDCCRLIDRLDDRSSTDEKYIYASFPLPVDRVGGPPQAGPALPGDAARKLMRAAYRAAARSGDRSTHNGAAVVTRDGAILVACNHHVRGVDRDDPSWRERPKKYGGTGHAEEAIVCMAARAGMRLEGATMVACWAACAPCARMIIEAGIARVYVHGPRMDATPDRWWADVARGLEMLAAAGVDIVRVEGPVDAGVTILFDGKEVEA